MQQIQILLFCVLWTINSIPYEDQLCLANSLIVGREDPQSLQLWDCSVCDDSNKPIHTHWIEQKAKDIKAILSIYEHHYILAFRFTATTKNVIDDLLYVGKTEDDNACSGCKIQSQYNKMWKSIWLEVIEDIRQMKQHFPEAQKMYVTGISLGGALAKIALVDFKAIELFDQIEVRTFGAPRVGNHKWAQFFNSLVEEHAYVVDKDPIPKLPQCLTLLCNYGDTGRILVGYINLDDARYGNAIEVDEYKTNVPLSVITNMEEHIKGYPVIYNFTVQTKPSLPPL